MCDIKLCSDKPRCTVLASHVYSMYMVWFSHSKAETSRISAPFLEQVEINAKDKSTSRFSSFATTQKQPHEASNSRPYFYFSSYQVTDSYDHKPLTVSTPLSTTALIRALSALFEHSTSKSSSHTLATKRSNLISTPGTGMPRLCKRFNSCLSSVDNWSSAE